MDEELPLLARYEDWPEDRRERQKLVQELIGRHFINAYDGWLKVAAETLFRGRHPKLPGETQQQYLDWIATLSQDERQKVYDFVCEIARGIVFSILAEFDGVGSERMPDPYRERLLLSLGIYRRSDEDGSLSLVESFSPSDDDRPVNLHQQWHHWLHELSKWDDGPQLPAETFLKRGLPVPAWTRRKLPLEPEPD